MPSTSCRGQARSLPEVRRDTEASDLPQGQFLGLILRLPRLWSASLLHLRQRNKAVAAGRPVGGWLTGWGGESEPEVAAKPEPRRGNNQDGDYVLHESGCGNRSPAQRSSGLIGNEGSQPSEHCHVAEGNDRPNPTAGFLANDHKRACTLRAEGEEDHDRESDW